MMMQLDPKLLAGPMLQVNSYLAVPVASVLLHNTTNHDTNTVAHTALEAMIRQRQPV